ncbi:membrane protein [Allgaiera indica]|uniref:Membrane protein n=1 Tax=Allgaiera indica TaxID=765699 RepID=A0AAN4UNK6_9RHOB|nr:membrane protein [Allgaiera indica]
MAYADFMTAMMAFFLLMWIVSSATKDQLRGISDYFAPAKVSMTAKGGLGALGGTTFGPKGTLNQSNGVSAPKGLVTKTRHPESAQTHPLPQMTDRKAPADAAAATAKPAIVPARDAEHGAAHAGTAQAGAVRTVIKTVESHAADDANFRKVEREVTTAMNSAADLRPLLKNVMFEQTKDGLNIQIVDQDKRPMFASGSAKVDGATLHLMQRLAKVIAGLPNKIRISGHTDAVPYAEGASHDNWELSSERANATRRVFLSSGVARDRIARISGVADTDPLIPEDPRDPRNRRITVTLAYQQPAPPATATATSEPPRAASNPVPEAGPSVPASAPPATAPQGGTISAKAAASAAAPAALARTYSMIGLEDLRRAAN